MEHEITSGAILITDDALLPTELYFESDPCFPDWQVVTNFTGLSRFRPRKPVARGEIPKHWYFSASALVRR